MSVLAARLAELLRSWGVDPELRQADLHAVAQQEAQDNRQAAARFHELKRRFAWERRGELIGALRRHAFIEALPDERGEGMTQRQIEREIGWLRAALAHARDAQAALDEAETLLASLTTRRAVAPEVARVAWTDAREAAASAEARRRVAAREARVEARAQDARRRAARLSWRLVAVPEVSSDAMPDADVANAALDAVEAALRDAEAAEDAARAAKAALRDPALAAHRRKEARELGRAIDAALAMAEAREAAVAIRDVLPRIESLRRAAAADAARALRARKEGRPPPPSEGRGGFDGYA